MTDQRHRPDRESGLQGAGGAGRPASPSGLELPEGDLELAPLRDEEEGPPSLSRETRPPLGGPMLGTHGQGASAGPPPGILDAPPLELDHSRGPPRGVAAGPVGASEGDEPAGDFGGDAPAPSRANAPSGVSAPSRVSVSAEPSGRGQAATRPEGAPRPTAMVAYDSDARGGRRRVLVLGGVLAGAAALAGIYYGMGWHKEKPSEKPKRRRGELEDEGEEGLGRPVDRPAPSINLPAQEVQLIFEVTPRSAVLYVRGREAIGHSLLVPMGDKPLEVKFEAKGHKPEKVRVVPDQNRTVQVSLTPE